MQTPVAIHPQLVADTHRLGRFADSRVLLHRNATVPWFILVPDTDATEFLELPSSLRARLLDEAARTGEFVQVHFQCPKINFAAIGNIVPQLHLHVVGRDPADPCWPNPIWGHLTESPAYMETDVAAIGASMAADYGLLPEA